MSPARNNARGRNRGPLLLCATIAIMVFACADKGDVKPVDVENQAFEDLRNEIRVAVADPAREAEAIRLVGVLQKNILTLRSTIEARASRLRELNSDYDTSRADFEAYLASIEAEARERKQNVVATHHALLAAMTAEERLQVDKLRSKAIAAAIISIQSI